MRNNKKLSSSSF